MHHHTPIASLRQFPRSRFLVTVCSLLSVFLFARTFEVTPLYAAPDANARCISEAAKAGLFGPDRNPTNTNFVGGTDGDDRFIGAATAGQDVFCGFGGNDSIGGVGGGRDDVLSTGDVFLGGAGFDFVRVLQGGTFLGGAGGDQVLFLKGGTFNGGADNDQVTFLQGGTFNGEASNDSVGIFEGGTFNGGEGSDEVAVMEGGTFNGEAGDDNVRTFYVGTFNGGAGDDNVRTFWGGTFNGEEGNDGVTFQNGGIFKQD